MQNIICPSCQTSYSLPADSIGDAGRKVKCAHCGNTWHASVKQSEPIDPVLDSVATANTDEGATDTFADFSDFKAKEASVEAFQTDAPIDAEFEEDPFAKADAEPDDVSFDADYHDTSQPKANFIDPLKRSRPKSGNTDRSAPQQKPRSRLLRPVVLTATLSLIAGLIIGREQIVHSAPDLASLYAKAGFAINVRGLTFHDIRSERVIENSEPVLIVTGEIQNISDEITDLPKLRFGLKTNTNEEIYAWNHQFSTSTIVPGGVTRFQSRLTDPPALGRNISIRFSDG